MKKIWIKTAILSFIVLLTAFVICGLLLLFLYTNQTMPFNQLLRYYAVVGSFMIIVGTLVIAFFIREMTIPITKLINATSRVSEGKYNEKQVDYRHADELGELSHNFNIMQKTIDDHIAKLKEIAQRQQLFVSGLTHEIKTPLTSMMLHADTLLTTDLNVTETENSLKHIYEQCHWIERLTQKLLMLLTMEEKLIIEPVKLEKLFKDVSDNLSKRLTERNTPLVIECEINFLDVDYDLMKSLLINLIDNASKASQGGQSIKLKAYRKKTLCKSSEIFTCIIEVSDSGHGIPKEEIEHVTEAFYMVDRSRSKKLGGSGLGLALVKSITDAHKAKLEIESELSKGTTVKIMF